MLIAPERHNRGYPRFSLAIQTASSDQSHRIYVHCQGQIHSHDARGPAWEGVQHRPLPPLAVKSRDASIDPKTP